MKILITIALLAIAGCRTAPTASLDSVDGFLSELEMSDREWSEKYWNGTNVEVMAKMLPETSPYGAKQGGTE